MAYPNPPLEKTKKQGEMPLSILSPIPFTNVEFRDGMGHTPRFKPKGFNCYKCYKAVLKVIHV